MQMAQYQKDTSPSIESDARVIIQTPEGRPVYSQPRTVKPFLLFFSPASESGLKNKRNVSEHDLAINRPPLRGSGRDPFPLPRHSPLRYPRSLQLFFPLP